MATRFIQQATKQLAPVFDQQIKSLEGQIPQIQNLFSTLSQSLQQQNQRQLDTGTQNIVEDASARGVLRSTLPVDARQDLTAQLGAALTEALGKLGLQQTEQIGDITSRVGGLRTDRATTIADLARSLETQDLERLKLQETIRSNKASESISRSSGGGSTKEVDFAGNLIKDMSGWFKSKGSMPSRQEQDKFVDNWMDRQGIPRNDRAARQVFWDTVNSYFGRANDPTKDWTWR